MHPLLIIIVTFFSCGQNNASIGENNGENRISQSLNAKIHHYDSLTIPQFFLKLADNHSKDFMQIDKEEFTDFCASNELNADDTTNIKKFFTLKIIHALFTSENASNGSRGKILNIPYFWHWCIPNPRHSIRLAENNKLLKDMKPPAEFSKYNSFADIDRTPYLFISELCMENQKYYTPECDSFATFGWCSEREMAFVCLMELIGYEGKVIVSGNHSWSEFIVGMFEKTGKRHDFIVKVDNTFDNVKWDGTADIPSWKAWKSASKTALWYDQKAHAQSERDKTKHFMVSPITMGRIEQAVVKYLNENLVKK